MSAILRSSTSSFRWEQKLFCQTITTLAGNDFLAWRMSKREDLLPSKESFGSVDMYRHALNNG